MLNQVIQAMTEKGYSVFLSKPYDINLVIIRGEYLPDHFNCKLLIFYKNEEETVNSHIFPITSYPGNYWIDNPMQPAGCAVITEGQHRGCWQLGFHYQIPALVNTNPNRPISWVRVPRGSRQLQREVLLKLKKESGAVGLNLHPVMDQNNLTVGQDSAGCPVVQHLAHFNLIMDLVRMQVAQGLGSNFTLTVIHKDDLPE